MFYYYYSSSAGMAQRGRGREPTYVSNIIYCVYMSVDSLIVSRKFLKKFYHPQTVQLSQ